jgi:hypothetical protein
MMKRKCLQLVKVFEFSGGHRNPTSEHRLWFVVTGHGAFVDTFCNGAGSFQLFTCSRSDSANAAEGTKDTASFARLKDQISASDCLLRRRKKDAHSSYSKAGSTMGAAVVSVMVIAMKVRTTRLAKESENCIVNGWERVAVV